MSAPASPTWVNRKAKEALRATSRRSAASAMTAPAPAATPFTAATMGSGHSRIRCTTEPVIRVKSSSPRGSIFSSSPMISCTSPPEQKPRPWPVMTRTRTSSRCGSSARRSRRSAYTSNVSAFSFSGRWKVTVPTPSATSNEKCFHSSVNGAEPRKGATSAERVQAGDGLAQNQGVDLVRSLVGVHRLEVVHVPDHRVLERDPVGSQDRPGLAADLQRLAHVVELAEAHLLRAEPAFVLHAAEMQRQQLALPELHQHVGQLALGELERPDRLAELVPGLRILRGGLEAGSGRSHDPPDDPEPRLVQRRQRPAQAADAREHRAGRQAAIVEHQLRRDGRPPP